MTGEVVIMIEVNLLVVMTTERDEIPTADRAVSDKRQNRRNDVWFGTHLQSVLAP